MNVNYKAKELIKFLDNDNFYVIADFDKTITTYDSISTWEVFSNPKLMDSGYIKEVDDYYDYYREKEIDSNLPFDVKNKYMYDWWTKHISLFTKYKLTEKVVNDAVLDKNVMKFRNGAINFLKYLYKNNIPLIIISSGIGNVIESFLKINKCYYDNIHILSNYLVFENGIAISNGNKIIHSLNKNEVIYTDEIKDLVKNKKYKILLGDQIEDIKAVNKEEIESTIKIGFLSPDSNFDLFKDNFDIVMMDDDYNDLMDVLFGINVNVEYCDPFDDNNNYYMRLEHLGRYIWAKDIIKKLKCDNVLDVACANGYGTKILSDVCKNITGIDNKKVYIEYAINNYNSDNINYMVMDIDKNEINDKFDAAICFETLEHVKYPEKLLKKIYNS